MDGYSRRNSLVEEESGRSSGKRWGRRAVSGALICLTGGVALSALDDLAIYHSCSRYVEFYFSNPSSLPKASPLLE